MRTATHQDLGDIADMIAQAVGQNAPEDKEAFRLIEQILTEEYEAAGEGEPSGKPSEPFRARKLVPYLKAYRFARANPWIFYALAGVFGVGVWTVMRWLGGRT